MNATNAMGLLSSLRLEYGRNAPQALPECPSRRVAMPQSQSRNAPTAKSQCPHILEHCGRNAPLLDGMPHFLGSRVFNIYIYIYIYIYM